MAVFTKKTYPNITLADMKTYIEDNAPQDKAWFKSIAFVQRKKKVSVPVVDKEGNPITYQVKTKDGKPKTDKNGNPVIRQKVKMVEEASGEENLVFNLLKAKREFYKRYFPKELPVKEQKDKASDILANW